jgi:hypothetical protein
MYIVLLPMATLCSLAGWDTQYFLILNVFTSTDNVVEVALRIISWILAVFGSMCGFGFVWINYFDDIEEQKRQKRLVEERKKLYGDKPVWLYNRH